MDKKILSIVLGFSVSVLSACLHEDDDSNKTVLEGTWKIGCNYNADDDVYETEEIKFSGNGFSNTFVQYADASCSMKQFQMAATGSVSIGDEKILTTGETVNEVDITITKSTATLGIDEIVTDFNDSSLCNKTDWQKDVAVDVKNCAFFDIPDKMYDIFKIDGSSLKFGDEDTGDGTSDATRPTQLDATSYTKQ